VITHLARWRWRPVTRAYCELDRWSFDPRYTNGGCPICGWSPAGAPAAPAWLAVARRVDWQLFGLFALAIVLILVGLVVAQASGFNLPTTHFATSPIASAARTASHAR
jgi:hypothetical protein